MRRRIGTAVLVILGAASGVGYRLVEHSPLSEKEIAQRQCIDDVANRAGDDDQGDAVEAQIAACSVENV